MAYMRKSKKVLKKKRPSGAKGLNSKVKKKRPKGY